MNAIGPMLTGALADVRAAARSLRRQPTLAVIALATFSIGIGATMGVFSIVDPLMMEPLPVRDADSLVRLSDEGRATFTYPDFEQLRDEADAFSGLAAAMRIGASRRANVGGLDVELAVQEVSGGFFEVLGVSAEYGRIFTASAVDADGPVAVVSDRFWRRRFQADPGALGSRIRYLGVEFTVIGVAPAAFKGLNIDRPADVWLPLEQALPPGSTLRAQGRFLHIVGRTRPGMALATVAAQASEILDRPVQAASGTTGFSGLRTRFGGPLLVLQLGVAAIWLIACANLANLMLLRGSSRARELATRSALGASRGRIVRHLLMESCLLGAGGTVPAVFFAYWLNRAMLGFLPPADTAAIGTLSFEVDYRLLAALVTVLVLSVVIAGLAPAMSATADTSIVELRSGASSRPPRRLRLNRLLAIGQVTLSTFVLIGATMFVRTVVNLWSVDAGYETRDVLVADLAPPPTAGRPATPSQFEQVRERLSSVPGVDAVAFSSIGQMSGYGIENPVYASSTDDRGTSYELSVSPGFFSAIGIDLLEGRDFTDDDREDAAAVAIVNESFVRRFLAAGPAAGSRFGTAADAPAALTVVGVVEDSKWLSLREDPVPMYYRPFRQRSAPSAALVVHAPGAMAVAERTLRELAAALEGELAILDIVPFSTVVDRTLGTERMLAQISTALGALALAVVAIGLYGLLAFEVVQRAREFGIRLALGAPSRSIQRAVARQTLGIFAIGVPIGLLAALIGAGTVATLLFGLTPTDPVTAIIGIGILAGVGAVASYLPVRKIGQIAPSTVLRSE